MRLLIFIVLVVCSGTSLAFGDREFNKDYDPQRSAVSDYRLALKEANETNRLVLVVIGGDWCRWCHVLDRYIKSREALRAKLLQTFVVLKVNVSAENKNEKFLSKLPPIKGFPHFIIIGRTNSVLGFQNTAALEKFGTTYSEKQFEIFIEYWKDINLHAKKIDNK
ncbi:MAG: thioredoxin-related protein [Flavobacteriales bacterium]|jgi:thioredoxin-related protein